MTDPKQLLVHLFRTAIRAAQADLCLAAHLPEPPKGRTVVLGMGKAAGAMAQALEARWQGKLTGLVIAPHDDESRCEHIEIAHGGHPHPDAAGMAAAQRMLQMCSGLTEDDLVLFLISGGGSALAALPAPGLDLADKQAVNRALLTSGAPISDINTVRRHLSAVKGGRLAAACAPARAVSLIMSDVPGDNLLDIASGPCAADPTTCADALDVLRRYGIAAPASVTALLQSGAGESVKPGDPRLVRAEARLIAAPQTSLDAAAAAARQAGCAAYVLGDGIEGEAREAGKVLAAIAKQCAELGQPFAAPCVLLSGGETTVTVRGGGVGGRNVEFLLSAALALNGHKRIYALAGDTDGIDGAAPVAGAVIGPDSLARARSLGLDPRACLDDNDAHSFFKALGDQVVTGPTRTNVNDFRAFLIPPP